MKKNVAGQIIGAQMITAADGSPFTGAVTVYVTGDGGTQAVGSVGSGACTHEGYGFHTYAPSQGETNHDHVAFTFVGTGAILVTIQLYPSFPQSDDAAALIGAPVTGTLGSDLGYLVGLQNMVTTTIASLSSQTVFTLTDGSSDDDAYVGCPVVVVDQSDALQKCIGLVGAYNGSTKEITLVADPGIFTMAAGDIVQVRNPAGLAGQIPFSAAGNVKADVEEINGVEITGDGSGSPFDVV